MTDAPTTRETADHAELARLRQHIANLKLRPGHHVQFGTPSVSQISNYWNRDLAADLEALLSEIAALRCEVGTLTTSGIIEVAVRNPSVADYVKHWEDRATQAERQRDEAVGLLRRWSLTRGEMSGAGTVETATSAFLANQGADQ